MSAASNQPHDPAAAIELLVMDVDGVLTDGSIVYDDAGREIKVFNIRDGFGIRLWREAGFTPAILTGRGGAALERRATELGIELIKQKSADKAADVRALAERAGVTLAKTAFLGDDWPDLCAMRVCGYAMCPADAAPEVAAASHHRVGAPGGRGAVREAVEHLLEAKGLLAEALARYDLGP